MRRLREVIESSIPIAGAVIIFLALILVSDHHPLIRLGIVLLGILVIEAGVWKLTSPFLPSERRYLDLREEVDAFIMMVRALNRAALQARASGDIESWRQVHEILGTMHNSVDHMAQLAGKAEEDDLLVLPPLDET